jgi:predicted DCC family thiol-disulfide oxidoreductase YuxK
MSRPAHRVLYDAECGFCRWSLAWVLRWDRARRLEPVALRDERASALLASIADDERMASWHLVAPDGSVLSAGAATAALLRLLPGGRPLAALGGRFPGALEHAYAWVARHRGAFGRPLGRRAIARAEATIAAREPGAGPRPSSRLGR